jgi:hypothetical protein
MRKILLARTHTSGWTTANSYNIAKTMISYQPIIDALERGAELYRDHPIVLQMVSEIQEKLGNVYVYTGGIYGLEVVEVEDDGVYVEYHDGIETYATLDFIKSHLL